MTKAKKILGLLGRAVDYSYSPLIHNTACELLDLPYYYTIFNVATEALIADALQGAKALGIAGFNVTIPYKKTVVPFLDELSPEAASIQAVNTIVQKNGRLTGYNTDISGFAAPLLPFKSSITGNKIALFGNGGAALAAIEAFRLYFHPSELLLFVRDPAKAAGIVQKSGPKREFPVTILPADDTERVRECRVLVNATPIGTKGRDKRESPSIIPLDRKLIQCDQIIYDMVYNPLDTPLLLAGRAAGAETISGIEMLIAQAAAAFTLWTGMQMPLDAVKTSLLQEIQMKSTS